MKKVLFLFLLSASCGFAQDIASNDGVSSPMYTGSRTIGEEKLLKKEDFKAMDGRMIVSNLACKINGAEMLHKVSVSVVCKQMAFNQIGVKKINDMILFANEKVGNMVNSGQHYKPSEIKMAYNPEAKNWSLTNLYSVTDDKGVATKKLLAFDFDSSGKYLGMKSVF